MAEQDIGRPVSNTEKLSDCKASVPLIAIDVKVLMHNGNTGLILIVKFAYALLLTRSNLELLTASFR